VLGAEDRGLATSGVATLGDRVRVAVANGALKTPGRKYRQLTALGEIVEIAMCPPSMHRPLPSRSDSWSQKIGPSCRISVSDAEQRSDG